MQVEELERLQGWIDKPNYTDECLTALRNALPDIIATYRALKSAESWLDRWAAHVGGCRGGHLCECGLTAILHEARTALERRGGE